MFYAPVQCQDEDGVQTSQLHTVDKQLLAVCTVKWWRVWDLIEKTNPISRLTSSWQTSLLTQVSCVWRCSVNTDLQTTHTGLSSQHFTQLYKQLTQGISVSTSHNSTNNSQRAFLSALHTTLQTTHTGHFCQHFTQLYKQLTQGIPVSTSHRSTNNSHRAFL